MRNWWKILFILLIGCVDISAQQLDHVSGEILVRLPTGVEANVFAEIVEEFNGKQTQFTVKSHPSLRANIWLYSFDDQIINEYSFLGFLKNHPLVITAQFNHWTEHRSAPNDLFYGLQWHWNNTGQSEGSIGVDADMEAAWDIATGGVTAQGDTIVLAIIDDGMDLDHPDLQQNLWVNHAEIPFNGIDDDENGFVDDYRGWNVFSEADNQGIGSHGTAVAGVAGAVGDNGLDVTGINWNVKIMSVMASGGTEAEIIAGYDYACIQRSIYNQTNGEQGAFVVATNTSFGIDQGNPEDAPLWCDFFDILGEVGILSVAATSNDNVNIDVVGDLPTTCSSPYLISVTATDHNDIRNFSGYGAEHVDIAAPGEGVWTLAQGEGIGLRTGTSFAAPAVTGLVGLLYALPCAHLGTIAINEPIFAAELVRDFIYSGVENIPNLADEVSTEGRMNAYLSLNIALNLCEDCTAAVIADETPLSPTQFNIAFVDFDSDSTDIFWKKDYDVIWNHTENINSPVLLSNLEDCTNYEYYLVSNCGENQITTTIHEIQTVGCCSSPAEVNWGLTDITTALINWTADEYNIGYSYRYKINIGDDWDYGLDTIHPPFTFSDMLPCTITEMQITPVCLDSDTSYYGDSFFIESGGCGTCTDANYCPVQGFSTAAEYIDGILIGSYQSYNGDNGGYGDFTGESIELVIGEENFFSFSPGFAFLEYEEAWQIWIDLDHSGTFDDDEVIFQTDEPSEGIVTGSFILPENTMSSSTRMRIAMSYAGDGEPLPEPCLSFPYGEVEDYCVQINQFSGGSGDDCPFPMTLQLIDSTENSVYLEWSEIANANSYEITYQSTDLSFSEVLNVPGNGLLIEDLSDCATYSLHIKTICGDEVSSIYSPVFEFAPMCMSAISEEENLSSGWFIFPNPTTDNFRLSIADSTVQEVEISILSADGKLISIQNKPFSSNQNSLTINSLQTQSAGVYFIKIQSVRGIEILKIVKQ
ncbi:MAG: serine protease [Saprospiraceae bacterium]|jgi:serine protease